MVRWKTNLSVSSCVLGIVLNTNVQMVGKHQGIPICMEVYLGQLVISYTCPLVTTSHVESAQICSYCYYIKTSKKRIKMDELFKKLLVYFSPYKLVL